MDLCFCVDLTDFDFVMLKLMAVWAVGTGQAGGAGVLRAGSPGNKNVPRTDSPWYKNVLRAGSPGYKNVPRACSIGYQNVLRAASPRYKTVSRGCQP